MPLLPIQPFRRAFSRWNARAVLAKPTFALALALLAPAAGQGVAPTSRSASPVGRPALLTTAEHANPIGTQALVERVQTKVVLIEARVGRGGRDGTGFFVAPGRVLTSEHVVRAADRLTVWSN